jgi:phenylpyruvate tautomerase PptA (4-oxalocrotonate tautomerase family)
MFSQGYAPDEKARLVRALTDAVRFVVPAPDEAITVMLNEYPAENYARGGQMRRAGACAARSSEAGAGLPRAMEARDLDTAQLDAGRGFAMTFPGTGPMTSLAELIDWAKDRYRSSPRPTRRWRPFHAEGAPSSTRAARWPANGRTGPPSRASASSTGSR